MSLQINDDAPDFEADTTQGHFCFDEWIGDSWAVRNVFVMCSPARTS